MQGKTQLAGKRGSFRCKGSQTIADREILMDTNRVESARNVVLRLRELVRGQEQGFLEELAPAVVRESVALDFGAVERIDAAGLAALITLYTDACKAGHTLTVSRPNRHVREILQIVGLERILVARPEAGCPGPDLQLQESAA
ncbi:MAG: STAS domain-containing protein [Terracidiphilus sp.]